MRNCISNTKGYVQGLFELTKELMTNTELLTRIIKIRQYMNLGLYPQASVVYQQTLLLLQKTDYQNAENSDYYKEIMAYFYCQLAYCDLRLSKLSDALMHYGEAHNIYKQLSNATHEKDAVEEVILAMGVSRTSNYRKGNQSITQERKDQLKTHLFDTLQKNKDIPVVIVEPDQSVDVSGNLKEIMYYVNLVIKEDLNPKEIFITNNVIFIQGRTLIIVRELLDSIPVEMRLAKINQLLKELLTVSNAEDLQHELPHKKSNTIEGFDRYIVQLGMKNQILDVLIEIKKYCENSELISHQVLNQICLNLERLSTEGLNKCFKKINLIKDQLQMISAELNNQFNTLEGTAEYQTQTQSNSIRHQL